MTPPTTDIPTPRIRRRLRRTGTVAAGFVLAAAAVSACGGSTAPPLAAQSSSAAPAVPAATAAQRVVLSEWKVEVPATLHAGQIAFDISNTGTMQHELLVFRSDLAPAQYPRQSNGDIAEEGAGITKVSDGDNLDAGRSQTRTIDLTQPGTYLFVCNLPAHFQQGMFTVVTVTP
jgi:uncharacterized cupredoxin-like copper-binding protein